MPSNESIKAQPCRRIPGRRAPRIAQGMNTLNDHAINGYTGSAGVMIAKGGRLDLSDGEIAGAVDYMVEESR